MADLHYDGQDPCGALAFFRANRTSMKILRRVLVAEDTTTVVDINGLQMTLVGLGRANSELVDLLKLTGASYNPATVHHPSRGTDKTKVFEIIKSDPWGQDRVA
jgi:hypothetical protein